MSGPYSGPFNSSSSGGGGGQGAHGLVAFLMALTETAASAAGAAAAAIAVAQEAEQGPVSRERTRVEGGGGGLSMQLPSPGMLAFYRSYEQYVETAALPSWWLKVRGKQLVGMNSPHLLGGVAVLLLLLGCAVELMGEGVYPRVRRHVCFEQEAACPTRI
jgi:hypothetical protein